MASGAGCCGAGAKTRRSVWRRSGCALGLSAMTWMAFCTYCARKLRRRRQRRVSKRHTLPLPPVCVSCNGSGARSAAAHPQATAGMLDALSPGLRPELLRSLLTQLPLTGAVSASAVDHVRAVLDTHALLAEVVPDSAAAVDAFVERVLALSASQQARDCERLRSSGALPRRAPYRRSAPRRTRAASQPPGCWP